MPSSTRTALNTRFTVVTPHPTVRGKYMVVTNERPCAGCDHSLSMCAYVLSPLGERIWKASKCTHCAATGRRCGQAGALYRFDKEMREGRLIDPNLSSNSEFEDDRSNSSVVSALDSGNDASSEEGTLEAAAPTAAKPNVQHPHDHGVTPMTPQTGSAPPLGSSPLHGSTVKHGERMFHQRPAPPPPPGGNGNGNSLPRRSFDVPAPLQLKGKNPEENNHPRPESPGKSVRFALPPSPPLSNTSPTAPSAEQLANPPEPPASSPLAATTPEVPTPAAATPASAPPAATVAEDESVPGSSSRQQMVTPPPDDTKLLDILNKLTTLEIRLGCLEGINSELRRENRVLHRKNSSLKRTMAVLRLSHRTSADVLARVLRLVDDVEQDRARLIEEIK